MTEQATDELAPARNAVRRAGSLIRAYRAGNCTEDQVEAALITVVAHRAQFAAPLESAHTRLRQIHLDLQMQGEPSQQVTQRLKKVSTIVDKLSRESGLDLSRMQDIGGCRVVVESLDHLRLVENAIREAWGDDLQRTKDYITTPRNSGYRAVHMIVLELGRQIEIQLRTETMHRWAVLVEAFSGVVSQNLKQDGQHLIQDLLRVMSEADALADAGHPVPKAQVDKIRKLGVEVTAYLERFQKEARKDTP